MGHSSRNSLRSNVICPLICLSLIITPLNGGDLPLGSRHEEKDDRVSRIPTAYASQEGVWRRRGTWTEVKTPSLTNHRGYGGQSIRNKARSDPSFSSLSSRDIDSTRVSPSFGTSSAATSLRSGRGNTVQLNLRTNNQRNFVGGDRSFSASDNGGRFFDRARVSDVGRGVTKSKLRTLHGKRAQVSKDSAFGDGRNHGGSLDSRKRKHKILSNNGKLSPRKLLTDRAKGRERDLRSRNSDYKSSIEGLLSPSSTSRRTVGGSSNYGKLRNSGSGIFSLDRTPINNQSTDLRNRSYRRQILDRSYFLPSFVNLQKSEPSSKENIKETSERDKFTVPYIRQAPKQSPLKEKRPNIVLIITDDLDVELGSLNYMPHLLRIMGDGGALFPNAYTTTPMCCPSRSSMLTGMYIHNHQVFTNNQNCSSPLWQNTHEKRSFASYLSKAGYKTGYFGKYLNRYKGTHVPSGWNEWAGLIMNSRYYNYTVNRNNRLEKYGNRYPYDYYPHVVTNDGVQFLRTNQAGENPFLLVLSYPAPHGPEDSAPEHAHKFFNASDHHTASYNYAPNPDKQWMLQFTDRMSAIEHKYSDLLMTKRLQTLQTVDSAIQKIVSTLEEIGEMENTYLFFTSDHGYHLGQFGLPKGKSMPFEFDVKVPFLVRGPGIRHGVDLPQIALNIDLAPTFLDIAGLPRPPQMDGRSLLPMLKSSSVSGDTERLHWRDSFLIESSGRLREEEEFEKKEQRTWERERALTKTLLEAASTLDHGHSGGPNRDSVDHSRVSLYTSKHQRLEEVCQRAEFATPCQRTQKWHCIKIASRWKIKKCRRSSSSIWHKHCICHFTQGLGTFRKLDVKERRKQRNFLKKYATKDFHSFDAKFIKYFNNIHIPLQFTSAVPWHHSRSANKRRNRRNRYERSVAEPSANPTAEFPLSFDLENFTNHFDLHPVDEVLEFDDSSEADTTRNTTDDSGGSGFQPYSPDSPHITYRESPDMDSSNESEDGSSPTRNEEGEQTGDYPSLTISTARTDDMVHHFVEEEELRDIKDQIHDITDEIHSLQSVGSTADPVSNVNTSSSLDSSKHGCHATDGHIDCQDKVYSNFSAWRNSKVEIEDQIRRLRQQLNVMKNILQHLQAKKPDYYGLYEPEIYDDFEEDEKTDDFYDVNMSGSFDEYEKENFTAGVEEGLLPEELEHLHRSEPSTPAEDDGFSGKQLTLPEVGLDIPLVEDVTYSSRNDRKHHKPQGKKQTTDHLRRKDRRRYDDNVFGKLYYPVSLPNSDDDEVSDNESSLGRFCWCDRRILKKIAVQEARERKRKERRKYKEKRHRKQRRKKKKSKSESCNYAAMHCYTHDNDHWRTPPLWTDGQFCFCLSSSNNTFWCLRTINETHNFLYCEFITGLITYYDLHIDPYQLRNVAFTLSSERVLELNEKLTSLRSCKGADECDGWTKRKESYSGDYIDDLDESSLGRKKVKRLRERQRKKKLRKENKYKKLLKLDDYAFGWPEDVFAGVGRLKETVRIPRKSRHNKSGKKQKRREKKRQRRKRRKQKRQSRNRYKKKFSPSISEEF